MKVDYYYLEINERIDTKIANHGLKIESRERLNKWFNLKLKIFFLYILIKF